MQDKWSIIRLKQLKVFISDKTLIYNIEEGLKIIVFMEKGLKKEISINSKENILKEKNKKENYVGILF